MKYSFVVPIYNIQDYLAKCIESLIMQECSDADFEIILVDDGSTDSSSSICDSYANKDSRIKVIHKENGGLTSSRKEGTAIATGDYIIPVDGDDFVNPEYLQYINCIVNQHNPDVIAMSYIEYSDTGVRIIHNLVAEGLYNNRLLNGLKDTFIYNDNINDLNSGCLIYSLWTKVVKRELYCECQLTTPDHIKLGEDLLVNSKILNRTKSVFVSNEAYYNYRISDKSMIHEYNDVSFVHYNNLVLELKKTGFINKNTIMAYSAMMIINQIPIIFANCKSPDSFSQILKKTLFNKELWEGVDKANFSQLSKKHKLELFLLRKKYFKLLYYLFKAKS